MLASIVGRGLAARGMPAPFIFTDELSYAELARSLADHGSFAIRDVPVGGYGLVYPILISPAYALFERLPDAYALVKAINVVLMSLAAVPAYLLARRAVGVTSSLVVAALTVAVPSMVYTTTVMTENAFYPLVVLCAWALVRLLESPGWRWTLAVLSLLAVAMLTRIQAVALVAGAASAPLLACAFDGGWRRLRRFLPLYGLLAGAAVIVVGSQLARGRPLEGLLGAYSVVGETGYDEREALRYWLWHLEELTLYLGIVPVAALLVLLARVRCLPEAARRHLAVTLAFVFWLSLVVAVFASRHAARIQERNLFFVAPLLFVALLLWVELRRSRDLWRLELPAVVAAGALAVFFPYRRFIDTAAISDTLALLPIWSAFGSLPFGSIWGSVLLGVVVAGALFLFVPRRFALAVPIVLCAYLCIVSVSVWSGERGFKRAGIGALFQGIRSVPRGWIDAAVPQGAPVAAIFTGVADRFTINVNEFFNRSLGPVYYIGGPTPGNLPETEVRIDDDGVVRRVDTGAPLRDRYVLVDSSVEIAGTAVARDVAAWGMTIWRVAGPIVRRVEVTVTGLYPGGTWSGPAVRYVRRNCDGGTLVVGLSSDEHLFPGIPTTVVAEVGGRTVGRVRFTAPSTRKLRVPLESANGTCAVTFSVAPTRNPAHVLPGSTDDRELGAHFDSFTYLPPG